MTTKQRTLIVELLRCAADERHDGVGLNGMFDAACWLDFTGDKQDAAWDAVNAIPTHTDRFVVEGYIDEEYRYCLLEAAARLEEEGM